MEKNKNYRKYDLMKIMKMYIVKDKYVLTNYLKDIFSDLITKSKEPSKGIDKLTFMEYYELPELIGKMLFKVFNKSKKQYLLEEEFVGGMLNLYAENRTFEFLTELIFNLYDFQNSNKILKNDVKIFLSHIPINKIEVNAQDRINQQKEIKNIIKSSFGSKKELTLIEFKNIIKTINSDIFLIPLCFILDKKPFRRENFIRCSNFMENKKNIFFKERESYFSMIKKPQIYLPKFTTNSLSSNIINMFKLKRDLKNRKFNKDSVNFKRSNLSKMIQEYSKISITVKSTEQCSANRINSYTAGRLNTEDNKLAKSTIELKKTFSNINNDYEGYIYKMTIKKTLVKIYYKLIGKDLYYYLKKGDSFHKKLKHLSSFYISKNDISTINGADYYNFSFVYRYKVSEYFYFKEEVNFNQWYEKICLAINYEELNNKYSVTSVIGKGRFGTVMLGVQNYKYRPVAIKVLEKQKLEEEDLNLVRTEIEVLKMCQHPNIIKTYDVFDTCDYIYIINELCIGKDLFHYLAIRDWSIPEIRACELIYKLSMAVDYIHSYGIIHRDIKPENIMMSDNTDDAELKLSDFGIAKIIGSKEKCREPFGTLGYSAPEVLLSKSYDSKVDIWSIGITAYLLLCGHLPFNNNKTRHEIWKETVNSPVRFNSFEWNKLSLESKEFVNGCVKKDPLKRYSIKQVLEHSWFKKLKTYKRSINKEKKKLKECMTSSYFKDL